MKFTTIAWPDRIEHKKLDGIAYSLDLQVAGNRLEAKASRMITCHGQWSLTVFLQVPK